MTINNLIHYKKSVVKNFDTFLEFIQFTDDLVSRKEYCILEYDEYSLSLLFFDGPQYYMTCNILEIIPAFSSLVSSLPSVLIKS